MFMNHKHEALWLSKKCKLYTLCTLILSNLLHLIIISILNLIKIIVEFQNVVMQILKKNWLCLEWPKDAQKHILGFTTYFYDYVLIKKDICN
jgi:hypothetical protein